MSNEQTHDTQEPTGARLTEAQVKSLYFRLSHDENVDAGAAYSENRQLTLDDVRALLADRAALVAEVARLQGDTNRNGAVLASVRYVLAATRAQNAEMRPLVEALANGDATEYYGVGTEDTNCNLCAGRENRMTGHVNHDPDCLVSAARVLLATLATEQTPAAPRLTGRERIQALRDAQATPPTGEITAIMVSRDSELTEPPVAPDTAATAVRSRRYPHFGLVWTVIDAVAAGDNERARAYADLLADHLDADNYPYEAKRIRNRLSPDYDPGPLLYLMAETPAAPTPLPTRYVRTEDGGIESAPGGLLYTADCNFTEAEWVALLALLNEGYDGLTWEEIEPLVVERIEATTAPTPDGAIIIPDDPREQARIQREIILDSGVDFAEHYAGLVDDPTDDDDAPTPDGQEGGDA